MPIRSDGRMKKQGTSYESPLEDDTRFAELRANERHYVALYGSRVRDFILQNFRVGGFVRVADVRAKIEASGGITAQYHEKRLGPDSVRLACHAVLRWMTLRGELTESVNGSRNGRMLNGPPREQKLDPVLDYHGYRKVEPENAEV